MCNWTTGWISSVSAMDWSSLIAAIIGGLIGGGFAILAGWQTHRNNLKLDEVQKQKKIDGILQAIRYELEILGQVYQEQAGGLLEKHKAGEPFNVHFSLTEKYFIVYPNNTDVVGQIEDTNLVKSIIVTYNKANFLIEMFRINNLYLAQQKEMEKLFYSTTDTNLLKKWVPPSQNLKAMQIQHTALLSKAHEDLVSETKNLLANIDDYRERHPIKTS